MASFLDARSRSGLWLVRIDDVDTLRNVPGAADNILSTLECFGLTWDGEVAYQSHHLELYRSYFNELQQQELLYPCTCSRKNLAQLKKPGNNLIIYTGICRDNIFPEPKPHSVRVKLDQTMIQFSDRLQGWYIAENIQDQPGDFIIKRKDRLFAYQFAVTVDDHSQHVNQVVRGFDLLDSTAKQIYIQNKLGFHTPVYMHVPLITDVRGNKLSKQTFAQAVSKTNPKRVIFNLLELLKQSPPAELIDYSLSEILNWGIAHWNPEPLKKVNSIGLNY